MVQPASITIRSQVLEVEVHGSEEDALALQRRLSGVCSDVVSSALEAALAGFDSPDTHLRVERLEIEVADVPLDRLEDELADAVCRQVADRLRAAPAAPSAPGARTDGAVQRRTEPEAVGEALLVFLRTGRLPWWFRVPAGTHLEELVLRAWGGGGDRSPPPGELAALAHALAVPAARTRLAALFTADSLGAVLRALSPDAAASVAEIAAALADPPLPARRRGAFLERVWAAAFAAAAANGSPGTAELVRAAWRASPPRERADRTLEAALAEAWPLVAAGPDPPRVEPVGPRPHVAPPAAPSADGHADAPRPATAPTARDADGNDGVVVDNAGIVLLHPFLPRFFEGLGVGFGDRLVEPSRAMFLLHHLATGERTAPEYRLTLAKVLCGVERDEPVDACAGPTAAESEETRALLEAAVGHWEALRGTSPDALRHEFLTRPGVLSVEEDAGWLLRVETRTADILLDRLPWGISMVRLPWMTAMLRVEWR